MAYRQKTKDAVKSSVLTLGSRIGRRAIYLGVSVQELSLMTGATRKTMYSWLSGGWIIPAYRDRARRVYEILKESSTREDALQRARKTLNIDG